MAPQDRERVINIVRDVHTTLALLASATRKRIEAALTEDGEAVDDDGPMLDRDTAQAALSLQRMAASLIESHPGLLEIANEKQGETAESQEQSRSRLRYALGLQKTDEGDG